jgi:hypothetical protein
MIYFDKETRQFSVTSVVKKITGRIPGEGYVTDSVLGGTGAYLGARLSEKKLREKYLAEGKTPEQIELLLNNRRRRYWKTGLGAGAAARFVAGRFR